MDIGAGVEFLLNPRSIAVIGASGDPARASFTGATAVIHNLLKYGYPGKIYPVNPKYSEIMGLPAYPDVTRLPEAPDCAVIGVASAQVPEVLKQCALRGVRASVILSSGFAELRSEAGAVLQREVGRIARDSGMRVCGPNCLGVVNVRGKVFASASAGLWVGSVIAGRIALVSQSGALSSAFIARAHDKGVGFSYVISCGNEADLEVADFVWYLVHDPSTRVIAAFVEGFKDGDKIRTAADEARRAGKPLVLFTVGKSEAGSRAARSHTGSLTGSQEVYDAFFKQYGIVRAESVDDLFEVSSILACIDNCCGGSRVGIVTTSGGAGGVASDLCSGAGLAVPEISRETSEKLAEFLPPYAATSNPVDPTADVMRQPGNFRRVLEVLSEDAAVDLVLVVLTTFPPHIMRATAEEIVAYGERPMKPTVVCAYTGSVNDDALDTLKSGKLPVFDRLEPAVRGLRAASWYFARRKVLAGRSVPAVDPTGARAATAREIIQANEGRLSEFLAKQVLSLYDIPLPKGGLASSPQEAANLAAAVGYPVVVKVASPDILHKYTRASWGG